jgi:hypothetical protein
MKKTALILTLSLSLSGTAWSQKGNEAEDSYTYLTMYYVDNSDGAETEALNEGVVSELKESLNNLTKRPDNYFFFYGCDGAESKTSNNLASFINSPALKKYLANPSDEADYVYDKSVLRDYFTENPLLVKQNVEINVFLSAYAVKRMMKSTDDIPPGIFLTNEVKMYVGAIDNKNLKVKMRYYINKEIAPVLGEENIRMFLRFCNTELGIQNVTTDVEFF